MLLGVGFGSFVRYHHARVVELTAAPFAAAFIHKRHLWVFRVWHEQHGEENDAEYDSLHEVEEELQPETNADEVEESEKDEDDSGAHP